MKPVLFTSNKKLDRAENIKAIYDYYDGEKEFIQTFPREHNSRLFSKDYALRVCDEFIGASPGKAIMIGHAVSGGKTYGLHQPNPYHSRRNAELLTWVITSSPDMITLVAEQSGVDKSRVLPLGMPRTDHYIGKHKGDGNTQFSEKRMYLYAPTFRNRTEGAMPTIDWGQIDNCLTDEEVLLVKPHMVTKHILNHTYRHIYEIASDEPSAPYLIDCDVLITDYSSIMFDAHILMKPVVLFEKNKGYTDTRGMYLEYPQEYSSRYCQNEKELLEIIKSAQGQNSIDIACRNKTASACDGKSRERLSKLIKETI